MSRILVAGLLAALAFLEIGCGCCHKNTTRTAAPPCCGQGGVPPGAIPAPPPGTTNFPPPGVPATYAR